MDTLTIDSFLIREIIKVSHDKSIIELYFNITRAGKNKAFKIALNHDGETLSLEMLSEWISLKQIKYEIFEVEFIKQTSNTNSDLKKLLNQNVSEILLGVNLDSKQNIYYFVLKTTSNEFLYYNNGDEGKYAFSRIQQITRSDIYNYEWINYSLGHID